MVKLKYRKIIFLLLIAVLTGCSMVLYAESQANFWFKTLELVAFQQLVTIIIYLICFGWDLFHSRS